MGTLGTAVAPRDVELRSAPDRRSRCSRRPVTAVVGQTSRQEDDDYAERILAEKMALEGERKHVTVLFADLKGSMELLADRDPEEARQLLDPVLERMMEAVHR